MTISQFDFDLLTQSERDRRRLVAAIDAKAEANPAAPSAVSGSSRKPPRVSGIALASSVGGLGLTWNALSITNLKRYEIQISTVNTFANPITDFTTNTSYTFTAAEEGVVYFARVRAINQLEAVGEFSATLNLVTGEASFELQDDSVDTRHLVIESVNEGGIASAGPIAVTNAGRVVLATVTFTLSSDVLNGAFLLYEFDFDGAGTPGSIISLFLVSPDGDIFATGAVGATVPFRVSRAFLQASPIVGSNTYSIEGSGGPAAGLGSIDNVIIRVQASKR